LLSTKLPQNSFCFKSDIEIIISLLLPGVSLTP
jgi:hypothetical protein